MTQRKIENEVTVTFRLAKDLHQKLRKMAYLQEKNVSQVIRDAIGKLMSDKKS